MHEPANLNEDHRMLFRISPALRLAALALLIPQIAGGCSLITTVAYLVAPEKDAPAEFKGLRGKHVAVVCKPIVELEFSDASSARELATMVGSQLAQNVRKSRVIDQREVARWIDENAWVDYPSLGKALDADIVVVLIGERPGLSSPDSLGIYFTWAPRPGRNDAERNCISNVRPEGLGYADAATRLVYLLEQARSCQLTGVGLKDESGASALATEDRSNFLLAER
jgi:hypothetical protein